MTEPDPDPESTPVAPLLVTADLTLERGGAKANVVSTGDRLFVEIDSIVDAITLGRGVSSELTNRLEPFLEQTDLTVEVRIRGRTVFLTGADSRPGKVSQLLGVDSGTVRVAGVLGAIGAEALAAVRSLRQLVRSDRGR